MEDGMTREDTERQNCDCIPTFDLDQTMHIYCLREDFDCMRKIIAHVQNLLIPKSAITSTNITTVTVLLVTSVGFIP